jgi:hypothetical protein
VKPVEFFFLSLAVISLIYWNQRLVGIHRQKQRARNRRLEEELVLILRNQRHAFMNHLQVISGWLQLNKPERAYEYLDQVAAKIEAEGNILKLGSPTLALAVLSSSALAESHGVRLEHHLQGAENADNPLLLETLSDLLAAVLPEVARRSPEPALTLTYEPITSGHCYQIRCQLESGIDSDLGPIARNAARRRGRLEQVIENGQTLLRLTWPGR